MTMTLRAPLRRLGVLTSIMIALGVVLAPPVMAHTRLLKSTPAKNAEVSTLSEVTLVFSEKVGSAKVLVRDASGTARQEGAAETKGATVTQAVAAGLAPGDYTIAYRVVSADGHPVQDQFAFTLTGGGQGAAVPPDQANAAGPGTGPQAASTPAASDGRNAAASRSGGSGGAKWMMIIGGLVVGVGIGAAFTVLRRKPGGPAADGPPAGSAQRPSSGD